MMYVFQRYHPSFFHILWTFSVLYLLDIGAKWVRTHTYNPVDNLISQSISLDRATMIVIVIFHLTRT